MIFGAFGNLQGLDPNVQNWANTAGITDINAIQIVNNFVKDLKVNQLWGKFAAIWPMVSDSGTSATAKTQFKYNLVNPNLYTGTYLNNNSSGGKGGWTNASSDTFNMNISPNTIGANYTVGFYTNSDAATTDQIDLGVYDGGGEFMYVIAGRNKSGGNAQILISPSSAGSAYNATNAGPFTGLFAAAGNSTTGYAYRRTSQLGTGAYTNTSRGDANNFGLGSFFQTNNTAISPTTKTYQFCFIASYMTLAEFGYLATAVNNMQGALDVIYGTTRKAY